MLGLNMPSISSILFYGSLLSIVPIGIYVSIYYAKLFEITRKQFAVATGIGVILSSLSTAFNYFTSLSASWPPIFAYTFFIVGPFIVVYLIYFLIAGSKNLRLKYNIKMVGRYHSFQEIKKLKELKK